MSDRAVTLLRRLEALIHEESSTQASRFESQWSLPLGDRIRAGKALEGLEVVRINPRTGRIVLRCTRNDSRFREGDYLFLHQQAGLSSNAPGAGNSGFDPEGRIEAVLESDEELLLEIRPTAGAVQRLTEQSTGWVADEGYFDLSGFYLDALGEVGDRETGRSIILPLILGELHPEIDLSAYERGWSAAVDAGLNTRQAEAAASAYASNLVHLIQGPPGTGKTFVLAHIAQQLAAEGARVLVTALTHRAINNALNKVIDLVTRSDASPELNAIPVCKIGHPAQADDLRADNYETFAASGFETVTEGYIIGATPFATRTQRLSGVEFDVVIFDEASQVTLPLALLAMLAGKRYIFIGDDRQLPPVTLLPRTSELAHTSIFGYLAHRGYSTMLNETYRMNDLLTAWPSRTFYADELRPAAGTGSRRLSLQSIPDRWARVLDPDAPAIFIDVFGSNTTLRSRREADLIIELILVLLASGIPPGEIGGVTPYRAQAREIRNLLRRALPDPALRRQIVVDTVERMQGQERDVVLVSLTTSSASFAEGLAEFYFQPQRLNVTITRPRTKLILVGSSSVLHAEPSDPELAEHVRLFRDMLSTCLTLSSP
jgi:DNA replication ATP-dependent helicase Dna2